MVSIYRHSERKTRSLCGGFDFLHDAERQINDRMIAKGVTSKKLDSSHFQEGALK
jgi:hypothetical protein